MLIPHPPPSQPKYHPLNKPNQTKGRAPVEEPFNEGAAQVRRLVQRDRKEMLGNAVDILDKYTTEFGDGLEEEGAKQLAQQQAQEEVLAGSDMPAAFAAGSSSSGGASASTSSSSSGGAAAPAAPAAVAPAPSSSPFAAGAPSSSPFGSPAAASPFAAASGAAAASPFGTGAPSRPSRLASIEPKGLSPDMGPDPIVAPPKDTRSWLQRITLTQVVLFFSFTTIILTMIATFFVVVNTGAVRLAGIE